MGGTTVNISFLKPEMTVTRIEKGTLVGTRSRYAGANARRGDHGDTVQVHLVKITAADVTGFGWSRITEDEAERILGRPIGDLFTAEGSLRPEYKSIEFPLLDWLGKISGKPVYALAADPHADLKTPFAVPCYDTTILIDDLHLKDDAAAVEFMMREAHEGKEKGHLHFKIKVGRGAMHLPLKQGMKRDIDIIRAIREVAGPGGRIMIDANNGYNLNLVKEVLRATAEANVYWVEEAFHEDRSYYENLQEWMREEKLQVLIADGEGMAAPPLVDWAKEGIVDVIQYDIFAHGFFRWLELGKELDRAGVKSAPHHYGTSYGNYAAGHLASAIEGFQFVEWDGEVAVPGLDDSAYTIHEGTVRLPELPGFGLHLDEQYFSRAVKENGWVVK